MKFMGIFAVISVAALAFAAPEPYVEEKRQSACALASYVRPNTKTNITKLYRALSLLRTVLPLLVRPICRLVFHV